MPPPVLHKWYKIFTQHQLTNNIVGFRDVPDYIGFLREGPTNNYSDTYLFDPVYNAFTMTPDSPKEFDERAFGDDYDKAKLELIESSSSSPVNLPMSGGRRRKTRRSKQRSKQRKSRSRRYRK